MSWLRRGPRRAVKESGTDLMLHHQLMTAFHQYCTETWNDSLAAVSDDYRPGDEMFDLGSGTVRGDQDAVNLLANAIQIMEAVNLSMGQLHASWQKEHHAAVTDLPSSAANLLSLTQRMIEIGAAKVSWRKMWLAARESPTVASGLDEVLAAERETAVAEALCLRDVRRDLRIDDDDFLATACVAFNLARQRVLHLPPLTVREFLTLYYAGIEGQRPRFFSSDM